MGTRVQLCEDGEVHTVDFAWLEEEVAAGRVAPSALLHHPAWTGDAFAAIRDVPALAEALDAPNARLAAFLGRRQPAWACWLGALLILLPGVLQLYLLVPGMQPSAALLAWDARFHGWATGFDPVVWDGAWWSPWLSQLVHVGPHHLLMNLAVVAYAGFRVERALGAVGYLGVALASLLGGVLAVCLFEPLPVVGSSLLAYGLWGAQLAIGFRLGEALPQRFRRYYGYGNLTLFAALFAQNLFATGVSHWGHAGGLLGGILAAWLWQPAGVGPRGVARRNRALEGVAVLGLIGLSLGLGPALRALPDLTLGAPRSVEVSGGLQLQVPARLLPDPTGADGEAAPPSSARLAGMSAWRTSPNSQEGAFAARFRMASRALTEGDLLVGEALEDWWTRELGGEVVLLGAIPGIGPGWTGFALERRQQGRAVVRVEEQHLSQGRWLMRVGCLLNLDAQGQPDPRAPMLRQIVASASVGLSPERRAAAEVLARNPGSVTGRLDLAAALAELGQFVEADALYASVLQEGGDRATEAVEGRVALWGLVPEQMSAEALGDRAADAGDPAWFEAWMTDYPADRSLAWAGIRWLSAHGRCEVARARFEALLALRPELPEREELAEAVVGCEG